MAETTKINSLSTVKSKKVTLKSLKSLSQTEVGERVFDLEYPSNIRMKALLYYYTNYGTELTELINKLVGMYTFSGTRSLEQVLVDISKCDKIHIEYRFMCSKRLCQYNNRLSDDSRVKLGYEILDEICSCNDYYSMPTPLKLSGIFLLMPYTPFKEKSLQYFLMIISDTELDCDYRYKILLSVEQHVKDEKLRLWYMEKTCTAFLLKKSNMVMYRILAAQYLLKVCKISSQEFVEDTMFEIGSDTTQTFNIRADATDVVLGYGSQSGKVKARELIMKLGTEEGGGKNIYENAQNVHNKAVEESVSDILEAMTKLTVDKSINFEYVKDEIIKLGNECKECDMKRVEVAFNRISMDRATYSGMHLTLENILVRLWVLLHDDSMMEYIETTQKRLLEELVEMAGTCSTGFASRLCNVVSGYGNLNIKISWEDQVVSNLMGRLNARIRNMHSSESNDDLDLSERDIEELVDIYLSEKGGLVALCDIPARDWDGTAEEREMKIAAKRSEYVERHAQNAIDSYKDAIMDELTTNVADWKNRRNFLRFFRKAMPKIRSEMAEEFSEHIDAADFDLYFRKAISVYEGYTN